ncbi:hypothetical protein B0H17DRAFT_1134977 [Mycena rosella]|uniref:Uncharacterized protein n=1 Tax=Mycena rosella TaxID=1033263 RepID=A0AAD7DH10_MYCRO|nr:hypothetical protein B0H17DRAFT_1134977 [Mycena rosella]
MYNNSHDLPHGSRIQPPPLPSGLLFSFDGHLPDDPDVDMPQWSNAAAGNVYQPQDPNPHSHHHPRHIGPPPRAAFASLPPIDTDPDISRLRTWSATTREITTHPSPILEFPSPAFNSQYLRSLSSPHPSHHPNPVPPTASGSLEEDTAAEPNPPLLPSTPTSSELLKLFSLGKVPSQANAVKKTWELGCYNCGTWIPTTLAMTRKLVAPGISTEHGRGKGGKRGCKAQRT